MPKATIPYDSWLPIALGLSTAKDHIQINWTHQSLGSKGNCPHQVIVTTLGTRWKFCLRWRRHRFWNTRDPLSTSCRVFPCLLARNVGPSMMYAKNLWIGRSGLWCGIQARLSPTTKGTSIYLRMKMRHNNLWTVLWSNTGELGQHWQCGDLISKLMCCWGRHY